MNLRAKCSRTNVVGGSHGNEESEETRRQGRPKGTSQDVGELWMRVQGQEEITPDHPSFIKARVHSNPGFSFIPQTGSTFFPSTVASTPVPLPRPRFRPIVDVVSPSNLFHRDKT